MGSQQNQSSSNSKVTKGQSVQIKYDILGSSKLFGVISIVLTLAFLVVIVTKGFNFGIDFAGGTEIQVKFDKDVGDSRVRKLTLDLGYKGAIVQSLGENNEYLIRLPSVVGKSDKETNLQLNSMIKKVKAGLSTSFVEEKAEVRRVDSVGPQVGSELKRNGLLAAFYSFIMILVYVGLRFDYKYAPGAVFCLFHDAIITLGIFSLFGREVNIQTMAAILTIIGYSLNDTIVTFDRIRENIDVYRHSEFPLVVNRSINDVLSRTLLTSITTMLSVIAMYALAGGVIRDFAFTLGIGVIVGTYSSIYVASPLVILVDKFQNSTAKA